MYITRSVYDAAESLRVSGDIAGMYQMLADNGDKYAQLALGVFNYDTLAGISATEYMKNVASLEGSSINEQQMLQIKEAMALNYMLYLDSSLTAAETDGMVALEGQILFDDTKFFHQVAFNDTGYSINNWTLTAPAQVMGAEAAQAYWEKVLDSAGDTAKEFDVTMELIFVEMIGSTTALILKTALDGKLVENGINTWFDSLPDATKAGVDWLESFLNVPTIEALTPNFTGSMFDWLTSQYDTLDLMIIDYLVDAFATDQFDPAELFTFITDNVDSLGDMPSIFSTIGMTPQTLAASLRAQTAETIEDSVEGFLSSFMKALYLPGDAFIGVNAKLQNLKSTLFDVDINGQYSLKPEYSDLTIHATKDLLSHKLSGTAEGYAFRYALENLNGFSVTSVSEGVLGYGDIYEGLNVSSFSEEYLDRRYELSNWADLSDMGENYSGNTASGEDTVFTDMETGFTATLNDNVFDVFNPRHIMFASKAGSTLEGNTQNDFLFGRGGNDTLIGNDGNDYLEGGRGIDKHYGGNGIDTYHFKAGDTEFNLTEGFDRIFDLDQGNLFSFGSNVNVESFRYYNIGDIDLAVYYESENGFHDLIVLDNWFNNQDMIANLNMDGGIASSQPPAFEDLNIFGVGSGQLSGGAGGDTLKYDPNLFSTSQYYKIAGFQGDDTLHGFDVSGGSGADTIYFYAPNGVNGTYGGKLSGGSGNDTIFGGEYGDFISTYTDGPIATSWTILKLMAETVNFDINNYNLSGTPGIDLNSVSSDYLPPDSTLLTWYEKLANLKLGLEDTNHVHSGDGYDEIYGGFGNEVYHFNAGEQVDRITDMGGENTLSFNYNFSDVSALYHNDSLYFYQGDAFHSGIASGQPSQAAGYVNGVTIYGNTFLSYNDALNTFSYQFKDGMYGLSDIQAKAFNYSGTAGDDFVHLEDYYQYNGLDLKTIDTGTGNDSIFFSGNNANILAGTGDDTVNLQSDSGSSNSITLRAGDGNDLFVSEYNSAPNLSIVFETNDSGIDVAADDIVVEEHHLESGQAEWVIRYTDNDSLTLRGFINLYSVNFILPAGLMLTFADFKETVFLSDNGGIGYTNSSRGSTMVSGTGQDEIQDNVSNDTQYLFGVGSGSGQDTLHDWGGQDMIIFGQNISESDLIFSRSGNDLTVQYTENDGVTIKDWYTAPDYQLEAFHFAGGTNWDSNDIALKADSLSVGDQVLVGTPYEDYLYGDSGNDTLEGGAGNDSLYGGLGDDEYRFGLGDGLDFVSDEGGVDRLVFGHGILPGDIGFSRLGDSLEIAYSPADSIIIDGWYTTPDFKIEAFEFDDGTIWDQTYLAGETANLIEPDQILTGTEFDDYLATGGGHDTVTGHAGNDFIDTGAGNDNLDGGEGSDEMYGGTGDDTYFFKMGDGVDFVHDSEGNDQIIFGAGITQSDISFARFGDDLQVNYSEADSFVVAGWYFAPEFNIESFHFDDGSYWNAATLDSMTVGLTPQAPADLELYGSEFDDFLVAGEGNDILVGMGGNDSLEGYAGNDSLDGGTGDDILLGGQGDDGYFFNAGDGQDIIGDEGGNDAIFFGESISLEDLIIESNGNDLFIEYGAGDSVMVADHANQGHLESIYLFNGTMLDSAAIDAMTVQQQNPEAA